MWYVVDARPGARVALGLTEPLEGQRLADAARTGEIENYLRWFPATPGDVFFVEAGLIHALDAGLTICEVQQNSDVTYRFYDWVRKDSEGRQRELHIEDAVNCVRHDLDVAPTQPDNLLASCPYFVVNKHTIAGRQSLDDRSNRDRLIIAIEGQGSIGGQPYRAGDAFVLPSAVEVEPTHPSMFIDAREP